MKESKDPITYPPRSGRGCKPSLKTVEPVTAVVNEQSSSLDMVNTQGMFCK